MKKQLVLEKLEKQLLIPVIRTDSFNKADDLILTLYGCGIKVIEITTTIPDFHELIEKWSKKMVVGAGTILNLQQGKLAIKSGAKFIVSPVTVNKLGALCKKEDVLLASGALTPNEIKVALDEGADVIKIFPAKSIGGATYLKSILDVFGPINLMPTGGVDNGNIKDYLNLGIKLIGMGSSLFDVSNQQDLKKRCKEMIEMVKDYRKE
jgi:2-dehydro-3-deoxyphosphogluconate aldolase / (4S)-4-hydroxy-2-oxoglutarate aldolase